MEESISKKIFINTSCFLGLMIFGMVLVMTSPILIEISQSIDRNIENMGSIFPFFYIGFIIGSFLSSSIINYWNRKKTLSFFYFLLFVSVFGMTFVFNYSYFVIIFSLIGLSSGFIESQVSTIVIEINKKNEGLFINLTQVFFGIGAFIGPLIPIFIISKGIDWRYSYLLVSLVCLLNFIYFLFINIPDIRVEKIRDRNKIFKPVHLDESLVFYLLVFAILFYVSAEMGLAIWLPTFLRLNKLFSSMLAGQVLSFFWLSFVAGRFLIGFLTKKVKILNILLVVTSLSIFSILLGVYTENKFLIIFAFILTGILFSSIWPLIVLLGGLRYASKRNFVVSILIMAGGVGGLFSPWFIGKVFSSSNLFFALNIVYIFLFFLLVLIIGIVIIDRKK